MKEWWQPLASSSNPRTELSLLEKFRSRFLGGGASRKQFGASFGDKSLNWGMENKEKGLGGYSYSLILFCGVFWGYSLKWRK